LLAQERKKEMNRKREETKQRDNKQTNTTHVLEKEKERPKERKERKGASETRKRRRQDPGSLQRKEKASNPQKCCFPKQIFFESLKPHFIVGFQKKHTKNSQK